MTGIIKMIDVTKGYGFISGEDGKEYFFHRSSIAHGHIFEQFSKRSSVEFAPAQSPKGPRAEDVAPA